MSWQNKVSRSQSGMHTKYYIVGVSFHVELIEKRSSTLVKRQTSELTPKEFLQQTLKTKECCTSKSKEGEKRCSFCSTSKHRPPLWANSLVFNFDHFQESWAVLHYLILSLIKLSIDHICFYSLLIVSCQVSLTSLFGGIPLFLILHIWE